MSTASKEVKYYICQDHIDQYEKSLHRFHPSHRFNTYLVVSANKKCVMSNCKEITYYECIGIQIPDTVGNIEPVNNKKIRPVREIFGNAKHLLDGGCATDRLTVFLKTKIIPQNSGLTCDKIIRHHAKMILNKLGIDEVCTISDHDKDRILRELELYPADWE